MTALPRKLRPDVEALLNASDEERIAFIELDHVIAYDEAQQVLAFIADTVRRPRQQRVKYLYVASWSNNGKSMTAEQIRAQYPPRLDEARRVMTYPVVVVSFPGEASLKSFCCRVLEALGASYRATADKVKLNDQMFSLLRTVGCSVLVVDEINNVLTGEKNALALQRFFNVIRDLGASRGICVVALGLPTAHAALCTDSQLANRFLPHQLPLWYDEARTRKFLRAYETIIPLREASNLAQGRLTTRITEMAEYLLGEIVEILKQAAKMAIRLKMETINDEVLDALNWVKPSARKNFYNLPRRA